MRSRTPAGADGRHRTAAKGAATPPLREVNLLEEWVYQRQIFAILNYEQIYRKSGGGAGTSTRRYAGARRCIYFGAGGKISPAQGEVQVGLDDEAAGRVRPWDVADFLRRAREMNPH